jgi:hypothetical protein
LNKLNTQEGIVAHFAEIAQTTGNSAYDPSLKSRNLTINLRTQENSSYKTSDNDSASLTAESSYPYSFDLTIIQRFDSTDPLAIDIAKAP